MCVCKPRMHHIVSEFELRSEFMGSLIVYCSDFCLLCSVSLKFQENEFNILGELEEALRQNLFGALLVCLPTFGLFVAVNQTLAGLCFVRVGPCAHRQMMTDKAYTPCLDPDLFRFVVHGPDQLTD